MNMFVKIAQKEFKILIKYIILISTAFIFLFSATNTLISLSFSLQPSFYAAYGSTWFTLESCGLDEMNDIVTNGNDVSCVLYGANGYTQETNNAYPYFTYKDVKTSGVVSKYTALINGEICTLSEREWFQLIKESENSENILYKKDQLSGVYILDADNVKEIENKDNIPSIKINSIIAENLDVCVGDEIILHTVGGSREVNVVEIYDYNSEGSAFKCALSFFESETVQCPTKYDIHITLYSNERFGHFIKFLEQTYSNQHFSFDRTFQRYDEALKMILFITIVLSVLFTLSSCYEIYAFISLVMNRRKKFLYHLKLIGAKDINIITIYSIVMFPVIILITIVSVVFSQLSLSLIAKQFNNIFDSHFELHNNYVGIICLFILSSLVFFVFFKFILNSKNNHLTYSNYRKV